MDNFSLTFSKPLSSELICCYELIQKLAEYEGEDLKAIISQEEFLEFSSSVNPYFHILAAKNGSEIVGIAIYYYRYSTWKGRHIHLEDLFIKEEFRQHGIGKMLLEELVSVAQSQKLRRLEWEVHKTNAKAINFYKKLGADIVEDWQICRLELH